MRSDDVKTGVDKAPQRSLLRASGLTDEDMKKLNSDSLLLGMKNSIATLEEFGSFLQYYS